MAIRIMVKESDNAKIKTIGDDIKELQNIVGGYIEYVTINKLVDKNIGMIVNEEGKFLNLETNLVLIYDNKIQDVVMGNIIYVGLEYTNDGITNTSLSEEQINYINNELYSNKKCYMYNKRYDVIEL